MSQKISIEQVESEIASVEYQVVDGTTTTICVVKSKSGPVFTGSSACISREDFDLMAGRDVAYKEARGKLWGALGTAKAFLLGGCETLKEVSK